MKTQSQLYERDIWSHVTKNCGCATGPLRVGFETAVFFYAFATSQSRAGVLLYTSYAADEHICGVFGACRIMY